MMILKGLTTKLKKYVKIKTAEFKAPKAKAVESAFTEINSNIKNYKKDINENTTKKFRESIKSIFKSNPLKNYYKPGETEKATYKRSGLAGVVLEELYFYLYNIYPEAPGEVGGMPEWIKNSNDKNDLKKAFENVYKKTFGSEEEWISSVLYNEKVLKKLFLLIECIKEKLPKPPKKYIPISSARPSKKQFPTVPNKPLPFTPDEEKEIHRLITDMPTPKLSRVGSGRSLLSPSKKVPSETVSTKSSLPQSGSLADEIKEGVKLNKVKQDSSQPKRRPSVVEKVFNNAANEATFARAKKANEEAERRQKANDELYGNGASDEDWEADN